MRHDDDNDSVLYEVNLEADAAIEGPFDTWLRDHVADMLQLEGFLSAEILVDTAPPPGRVRRSVQYRLRDQAALDGYLREHAPQMRQRGIAMFGDRFSADRRVLAHREEFIRGRVSTENCLNCGEVLTGQHCSHCGQRAKVRVLSLTGLLRDLFGDLTEWDSRIWRTLRPLAFKPGLLTAEYLRGRRTLYTPPFRMYLVLSVVFFLATSIVADPGGDIQFEVGDGGANLQIGGNAAGTGAAGSNATPETPTPRSAAPASNGPATGTPAPTAPQLSPDRQRIVDAIVNRLPERDRERARAELSRELGDLTPDQVAPVQRLVDDPCGGDNIQLEIGTFGDRYEPKLRDACRKIMADSKTFGRALYENVPKMMFIFLPLIAGVMFVLYLGSGRYYVEHLLFFVHYHAFFFLAGFVVVLLDRVGRVLADSAAGTVVRFFEGALTVVLVFYLPYYLYRAMRNVYGQGRAVTLVKYSMLGVGYVVFMALTVIGLLAYTALTL
ncbi:MAG TPA: DUF4286 family protein [Steroidobacteraceae bacterium]|nr:DUF4286 family protein [Steroidobacteraceae bacterium]